MKDFGQWFSDFEPISDQSKTDAAAAHIAALEDAGVIDVISDGRYMVRCCRCDRICELPVGPDEIDLDYQHYGNCSERCIP